VDKSIGCDARMVEACVAMTHQSASFAGNMQTLSGDCARNVTNLWSALTVFIIFLFI